MDTIYISKFVQQIIDFAILKLARFDSQIWKNQYGSPWWVQETIFSSNWFIICTSLDIWHHGTKFPLPTTNFQNQSGSLQMKIWCIWLHIPSLHLQWGEYTEFYVYPNKFQNRWWSPYWVLPSASQICFCMPLKTQYISEKLVYIALTYGAIEGIKKTNFHKIFKIPLFRRFLPIISKPSIARPCFYFRFLFLLKFWRFRYIIVQFCRSRKFLHKG